jgi:pSer/pThr/pTyr-binding forkhead associated (FHA) protein
MKRCPSCNATIRIENTRQCPSCGAVLTEDDAPTRLVVSGRDTGPRSRTISRAVHLVVVLGRTRLADQRLDRGTISIGRDGIQDVVLDNPSVSRRHCQIRFIPENGAFVVEDLGSDNGTLVNGTRISSPAELVSGDEIGVGKLTVLFNPSARTLESLEVRPQATAASPAEEVKTTYLDEVDLDRARDELALERGAHLRSLGATAQRFPLEGRVTVLGRSPGADVPLVGPPVLVGRRHAEIEQLEPGRYLIRRVGGLLAVRINGRPIRGGWELGSHDRIVIGRNRFQFFPAV